MYRMVNTLEEIGAISRKNMYKFTGSDVDEELECVPCCRMELDDGTVLQLSDRKFRQVLTCGLESWMRIKNYETCSKYYRSGL